MPRKSAPNRQLKKINFKLNLNLSARTKKSLILGLYFLTFIFLIYLAKSIFFSIKNSIWADNNQLTLALEINNQIGFVKIDPVLQEVKVIYFPDNAMIKLSNGFDQYRAKNIRALAKQENIPLGLLLKNTSTQFLGILTDGYIISLQQDDFDFKNMLKQIIFRKAKTNLSGWDVVKLFYFCQSLKPDQIESLAIKEEDIGEEMLLPDGTNIYTLEENKLDLFMLQNFANPDYLKEKVKWEIYNTTSYDGLAESMKKILINSGFDVIGVRQASETDQEKSSLFVSSNFASNKNIKKIAQFFNFKLVIDNEKTDRADVVIYLGEDYWLNYFQNKL